MFGNYEQCVAVRVLDDDDGNDADYDMEPLEKSKEFFRGQFCVVEFKPWLPKKPKFYGMNTKIKNLKRDEADESVIYGFFSNVLDNKTSDW